MVADCRARGPALWIPHAVGAPFMTPVRVYGGGLSGMRSGGVCAVRVFGRHKWRPYVFCGGMGCGGVFIAFAPFRWCCAVPVFGRHKWRPYVFAAGWGCGGVFIAFAPFRYSGVINGAPTFFCGGMGIPVALAVVPVALIVSPGGVPVRGCGVAAVSVWQSGKIVALKIISIGNLVD